MSVWDPPDWLALPQLLHSAWLFGDGDGDGGFRFVLGLLDGVERFI